MKKSWSTLKRILRESQGGKQLFLTLIDGQGRIRSANHSMLKGLCLKDPRESVSNFFDLIHPIHRGELVQLLNSHLDGDQQPQEIELYIRNGTYNPMKWQINRIEEPGTDSPTWFCLGYKLLDEDRLRQYNSLIENHGQLIIESLCGILFQDYQGEIIAANQQLATMFGTSLERLYQIRNIAQLWNHQWVIEDECGHVVTYEESPFRLAQKNRNCTTTHIGD